MNILDALKSTVSTIKSWVDENKVQKVSGKGLSTNDYTTDEKNKLSGIENGATKTTVDSVLDNVSINPVQNKVVNAAIDDLKALVGDTSVLSQINSIILEKKGKADGLAELDSTGKIPAQQLPSYVDTIVNGYFFNGKFFSTKNSDGTYSDEILEESGKIYIDLNTNKTYRWSGSVYTIISESLALGTTSSTAFRGDYGKEAYDHATAKGSEFDSGLYKFATNDQGHVISATTVTKADIVALGIPGQSESIIYNDMIGASTNSDGKAGLVPAPVAGDANRFLCSDGTWTTPPDTNTTYAEVTTSVPGLMSIADKQKLDSVESEANKTIVDSVFSSTSTNPVQNKVISSAITNLQTLMGDVAVSTQIKNAIDVKADISAGTYAVITDSTDGVVYEATVPGITVLKAGIKFIMLPSKTSTSIAPALNVNNLGEKPIKRRLSSATTPLQLGYSEDWISANNPLTVIYDGISWIVEGVEKPVASDLYGVAPRATADENGNVFVDTYATIAMLQNMLPKITTITLNKTWNGSSSPYYQDVSLSCVTETSIVDLQPSPTQLVQWQDDGLTFVTQSGNKVVRIYVVGGLPNTDISVQIKVQETVIL